MILCQNRIIRHFREAGALSPDTAMKPVDIGCGNGWIFRGLVRRGVIVAAGGDAYYLHPDSLATFLCERWKRLVVFGGLVFAIILVVWLLM
jgi:hypothetical protein